MGSIVLGQGWTPGPALDDAPEEQIDYLALRLELVLEALETLRDTITTTPAPHVNVEPPDLTAIVNAVNSLKVEADPEQIAEAITRAINRTPPETPADYSAQFTELLGALRKLDVRLANASAPRMPGGLLSDVRDRADRQLGHVTVDAAPAVTGSVSVTNLPATQAVSGTVTVANPTANPETGLAKDATLTGGNAQVQGNAASGATDAGNPLKIGGKVTNATPVPATDGQRVNAWFDGYGRQNVALHSAELNTSNQITSLRDLQIAQRYTVLADSVADGLAGFWTSTTTGSGVAPSVTGGEGLLQSGAAISSSSQLTSTPVRYYPGQSTWLNSAIRFGDTGTVGNTRRIGVFTVTGTAPQDGFCFELIDTTFYATVYKAGSVVSQVATTSWSRFAQSPFTLDTNYHSFEIRYTANGVQFYIDNVVKHVYSGTTSAITSTLNFPMTLHSVNTTATANCVLAVRNIGIGRFGQQPQDYSSAEIRPDQTGAGAVLTFTFNTPVDFVWVNDVGATTSNISRVDPFGGTPSATAGIAVYNQTPTPIQVVPPSATVKVYAATGSTISMYGLRYV